MERAQIIQALQDTGFIQEAGITDTDISAWSNSELASMLEIVKEVISVCG